MYHAGFTGRAQPAFFLCEDAGIAYEHAPKDRLDGQPLGDTMFACPAIRDGDRVVSQTVAVVRPYVCVHVFCVGGGVHVRVCGCANCTVC